MSSSHEKFRSELTFEEKRKGPANRQFSEYQEITEDIIHIPYDESESKKQSTSDKKLRNCLLRHNGYLLSGL